MITGRLELRAVPRGERTIVERVRYDGVSRCSRTFYRDDGAATVMLSQLGPGVVRGDRIEVVGTVREGAHLIVTEQSATRILGGERASAHSASWTVEAGATLELRHEPILALAGSDHRIATHIHAQSTSIVVIREIVNVSAAGRLRLRTLLSVDGREAYYDGIDLDGATTGAVGTLVAHGTSRSLADTFDAASREVEETCRIGIGTLRDGTHARCTSSHVWSVRRTLEALEKRIATCVDQPR